MPAKQRYRQDLKLPSQEIRGEAVIVVPSRSEVHVLDEVGTFLWNELRRTRSMEELAARVGEEYEVAPEQAAQDVRDFVETLLAKGLLIPE